MSLPFLTLPDPKVTAEGVLDPLGLSTISDRLAEQILPGLRARMSRPRFLTAMAVCAAVCDGIEDRVAKDSITPTHVVFEWLVVEAFVRTAQPKDTVRTPGMHKAQAARDAGEPMRARAYLKSPTIFGFNGVYRPLARHVGIVDDDMRLGDHGYGLVKEWESEQGLEGFLPTSTNGGPGASKRSALRAAVTDGLENGYTSRSAQWAGWQLLAETLVPARIGKREAAFVSGLLVDQHAEPRGELVQLVRELNGRTSDTTEKELVSDVLLDKANPSLRRRLLAILHFETACTLLEDGFDWIRHLSTSAGARAITVADYEQQEAVREVAAKLPEAMKRAEDGIGALENAPSVQQAMTELAQSLDGVRTAQELFEALLGRHHDVQQAKPPEGKRDWFERGSDGATFVRIPYRAPSRPEPRNYWNRPYRLDALRSFIRDLGADR